MILNGAHTRLLTDSALVINSIIVPYYLEHAPQWNETKAGHWAAMFGLLNIVSRPFGGIVSDLIYRRFATSSQLRALHFKKYWMLALTITQGTIAMSLGLCRPSSVSVIIGCMAILGVSRCFGGAADEASAEELDTHPCPLLSSLCRRPMAQSVSLFWIFCSIAAANTRPPPQDALLPSVNPHVNGLMGGAVGSSGNFGKPSTTKRCSFALQTRHD